MTLDLHDELQNATSDLHPTNDLISRARVAGQLRLTVRRRRYAVGALTAVTALVVGIATLPNLRSPTSGGIQAAHGTMTPQRPGSAGDPQAAYGIPTFAPSDARTQAARKAAVEEHNAQAQQRCQAARALQPQGTEVLFVSATTVGSLRTRAGVKAAALTAEPWAGLTDSETAAWCTIKTGSTYKIIAATVNGASITFVTSVQPLSDPGVNGPATP